MLYTEARRPRSAALTACAFLTLLAAPAAAQVANQSDVSGISVTSSSIVSPVFGVSVGGAVRVITFVTPQVAQSYQETAARVNAQLSSQSFAGTGGYRPPPTTQNLLYEVTAGGSASGQAAAQLLTILTTDNASPQATANAQAFVESFRGLLVKGIAMDTRFFNSLTATQLANSVAAYNAFIDSSSESFLTSPPPELPAIHDILVQLTRR